jgi:hypothetical protein
MPEHGHGHSTAAWTAVGTLLLATFLICLAIIVTSWPLAVVGMVLAAAGLAAGKILAMAGLGQAKPGQPGPGTVAH